MWEKNTLNEVKLSTKYFSFPLSFVLLPVYLTDVPSLSFLLGFRARPKAIPVQDTVYCDITLLCYCLGSTVMKIAPNQKDWCTRHFSHAYCCLAAVAGEHWFAMGVHSSEQVFHISLFFFSIFVVVVVVNLPLPQSLQASEEVWIWTLQLWLWVIAIFSHIPVY